MPMSYTIQFINLLAAILLLIVFAMLSQRRILSLINLFAWQGLVLTVSTFVVAYSTGQSHLYYSAALTLLLKVLVLPWLLHRLIRKLNVRWDVETLINIPTTMLVGIALVIFAFNLAAPISQLAEGITRGLIGIALASVLLSLLMMLAGARRFRRWSASWRWKTACSSPRPAPRTACRWWWNWASRWTCWWPPSSSASSSSRSARPSTASTSPIWRSSRMIDLQLMALLLI